MKKIAFIFLALAVAATIIFGCHAEPALEASAEDSGPIYFYELSGDMGESEVVDESFTSDKNTELIGTWGRVMNGAAQTQGGESNFFAESGYCQLNFLPGGLVKYEGVNFFKRYKAKGTYEVKLDENIVIWTLTEITEPKDDRELEQYMLGSFYGELNVRNGRRTLTHGIHEYQEGISWDWDTNTYRDENNDIFVLTSDPSSAASQLPTEFVGHDGGGWVIESYNPATRLVSVSVYETPIKGNERIAKDWLASKGVSEDLYELYFYSPAFLSGQIGP